MRGFGALRSVILLFTVWFNHKFFRRYGLQDNLTVVPNAAPLFVVLFTFIRRSSFSFYW